MDSVVAAQPVALCELARSLRQLLVHTQDT